jgi:hypothetical protein
MLRTLKAFFDEPFIIASPLVVFIGAGGRGHFVSL